MAHLPVGNQVCPDCEIAFAAIQHRIEAWVFGIGALVAVGLFVLVLAVDASQMFHNGHVTGTFVCAGATAAGVALLTLFMARWYSSSERGEFIRSGPGGGDNKAFEVGGADLSIAPPTTMESRGVERRRHLRQPGGRETPPRFQITWWR